MQEDQTTISYKTCGDIAVASPGYCELTSHMGEILIEKIDLLSREGRAVKLVLDLSNLNFLGSIGLGIMVDLLNRIKKCGGSLVLASVPKNCRGVLQVSGLDRIFPVYDSVELACEALSQPVTADKS